MEGASTDKGVLKSMVSFSLPFLLSYFLQTLYGMADLFIIGRYEGADGTTAVSIGSQVMHMITVITVGLAMGVTVNVGQAFGASNLKRVRSAVGNTVTLFLVFGVALAVVLFLSADAVVSVMSTPEQAVEGTRRYLRVCFAGIPFITAYNVISSVYRGVGDSKTPLFFIAVACAVNIALDFIFMGVFGLGAVGAALGTVIAQGVGVAVALVALCRKRSDILPSAGELKPKSKTMRAILGVGVPIAVQDGLIQIAFIVITVIANKRGLTDAAAVGIVEKIIGFVFLVPSSLLGTVSALGSRCIGAGRRDTADTILKYAVVAATLFGVTVSVIMQFCAENVVSLFQRDEAVALAGAAYLKGYIWDCIFAGIHFSFSGWFCACGKSYLSFIHNIASVSLVRVPWAYLMSVRFPDTLFPMGLATAAGSLLSVIICVAFYGALRVKAATENKR